MRLLQILKQIYGGSFVAKIGKKILAAYHGSRIFSLNTAGELDDALGSSVLLKPKEDKQRKASLGIIVPILHKFAYQLTHISVGMSSLLLLVYALSTMCSFIFKHDYHNAFVFLLCCALLVPLCFIKTSVRNLFSSCFLGRFFNVNVQASSQKQNVFLMILLHVFAVAGGFFLPFPYSVLTLLLPIAFLLIFYAKPLLFIGLIMVCLPIFGTSVCMVLSVLLILSHWLQRGLGTIQKQRLDYNDILLLVYVVLCLLFGVLSFAIADGFRIVIMWITLFSVIFIIYRNITSKNDLIAVFSCLFIGAVFACGAGIWQFLSGQVDTTWTDTELFQDLSIRVYGTFANPNVFGEFLILVIPFSVGLGIYLKKIKYKLACIFVSIICFVTLALTYSRGCYVGIAVTAVVFLWMYNKKILGLLLVFGAPVGIAFLPENILARIASMVNLSDSSTSYRLKIYKGTFNLLGKFWPSGVGIGEQSFNYVYPFYGVQEVVAQHSHSLFLQILVSFGMAGFIYFLFMVFLYHRNLISFMNTMPKKDNNRMWLIMFASVFFGFLVQSIFDYTWYNYRIYMLFWIIFGLGLTTYKILKKERCCYDKGNALY